MMMMRLLQLLCVSVIVLGQKDDYPAGYYPFQESFNALPPKVRKPPYLQTNVPCQGSFTLDTDLATNLCGDLSSGTLPLNPLGQNVLGESYPFELIKNKTLAFFSKTLPVLRDDHTLPKVAKFSAPNKPAGKQGPFQLYQPRSPSRNKRSVPNKNLPLAKPAFSEEQARQARALCEDNYGIFCSIYNMFQGQAKPGVQPDRSDLDVPSVNSLQGGGGSAPPTPCPSTSEYVTPVFAKNYQGVWRYVVQIPLEGYFTQTLEKISCVNTRCSYMEGSCLTSPRWVSLLVAEMFYPDSYFPTTPPPLPPRRGTPSVKDFDKYQQFLVNRAGVAATTATPQPYCDGHDNIGCFQVRLYYDWFLVPGSCKCWRADYFSQFTGRSTTKQ